ncbi:zinc finger C2HC domain-containing protein 1C-like [Trematomus bernacchii]|uniref:zinc finger C2HC domain-containing protein 1C-like n=1 Tax=Trematomus bernacchii TaxID=40690 RepID=UPI00146C0DD2|nr:zinc finger C2HC domain-containing protein 1C-like [Trematomus bernacchii]
MARAIHEKELMLQEKLQEDVKQLRRMQDQRNDDRISIKHEEERARWEKEVAQSQRKSHKGTQQTTVHEQEVSGEFLKSTRGNVKEHTGSKRGEEKGEAIWGKTGVRSQDGTVKTKERADKDWSRERKYKELYLSEDERDMPQSSQQITSHKAATGNSRGAERKVLPPVSHPSHSSREQGELRQEDSTDTSLQQVPCSVCNRMFTGERLQKHLEICTKLKQSKRTVFNIYVHRTKGSAIEEYWKTHTKSPEVLKKKTIRHLHKTNISNLEESRLPTGTSKPKWAK